MYGKYRKAAVSTGTDDENCFKGTLKSDENGWDSLLCHIENTESIPFKAFPTLLMDSLQIMATASVSQLQTSIFSVPHENSFRCCPCCLQCFCIRPCFLNMQNYCCMCATVTWNHTFFTCDSLPCFFFILNAPFSSGWTSEAEDWRRQHASVCRERPLGSLSEHRWTGAAGSTATDTDAAGGEEQLIKHTLTDSSQIIPAFITTHQAAC